MHIDDAIQFLSNYARRRCTDGGGRDIYIPEVLNGYWTEVLERPLPESLINSPEGRPFVPVFCDAAWELCRRGIFRPGRREPVQSTMGEKPLSFGFAITVLGRAWLQQADEVFFIPTEPGRFTEFMTKFQARLGDGFWQRVQEASRCHSFLAYLACCAMCGAAAESIMLRVAIDHVPLQPDTVPCFPLC